MDSESFLLLSESRLKNVRLIELNSLEIFDQDFGRSKHNRTRFEHYAACKPSLILHIFALDETVEDINYLDSDLYFFSALSGLHEVVRGHSVAVAKHNFKRNIIQSEIRGRYNAGWIYFKRNEDGYACLQWWRAACIEWCKDIVENGKYADQKYIETFFELTNGCKSIDLPSINLGPWNIEGIEVANKAGIVVVNEMPLVFFHFHGLKLVSDDVFDTGLSNYRYILKPSVARLIYIRYLRKLSDISRIYKVPFLGGIRNTHKRGLSSWVKMFLGRLKRYYYRSFVKMNYGK